MAFLKNILNNIESLLASIPSPFKSYTIPVEDFKKLFSNVDSTKLSEERISIPNIGAIGGSFGGAIGGDRKYLANPIIRIKCYDKNGKEHELINGPTIETRITLNTGRKTVFYFDTLYISGENIVGNGSRFLTSHKRSIPLNDITKIEVKDGRKGCKKM